jgi:hypothetical protein
VINIAMISVTDEPMEGVAFDVQDHAQWTGTIWTDTHGEMTSSNLHGAREPTRCMLRPHQGVETGWRWIRAFASKRKRTFHQRHSDRTRPGGNDPFSMELQPWKAWDVSIFTKTSSSFMDALEADWATMARVACWRGPGGVNVLLLGVSFSLEGASTSLEEAFTLIFT